MNSWQMKMNEYEYEKLFCMSEITILSCVFLVNHYIALVDQQFYMQTCSKSWPTCMIYMFC